MSASATSSAAKGKYRNFSVAIYIVVGNSRKLADPQVFEQQFARISSQLKFDKVYLELYRNRQFLEEPAIESIKQAFAAKGIAVSGGVTLAAGGQGGQFGTFAYTDPNDRAECQKAVELAARHFDEVMLDDFFFYSSKTDADIAAKGKRSWTQYRLDTMREVTQNLVLKPAKAINPNVKMIIKYPNWYEHFQATGYDLDVQAKAFDAIYTGTETRDPYITDQTLQQYESYLIFRYFENIRPGANLGGWVDTFDVRYMDRYPEQLADTMLAKAPEMTLFSWAGMASEDPLKPGDRAAWAGKPTSFSYEAIVKSYQPPQGGNPNPGWARAAGHALEQVDAFLDKLGTPIGVASYKPYQSSGEDFLHNYLGNIGLPIELYPSFPANADTILLTECCKHDPEVVAKIKAALTAGRKVCITSGLLQALQGKGIEDIVEVEYTHHKVTIREFVGGYGSGSGSILNDPQHDNPAILFPEIRFNTNDSWPILRGLAGAKAYPIVLMNRYSKGIIYVLAIPENMADLYALPQAVTHLIKRYLQGDLPVRIDSPVPMNLYVYDNNTFIVQSFLHTETKVNIHVPGEGMKLRNLVTGEEIQATPARAPVSPSRPGPQAPSQTDFTVQIQPHSYLVFGVAKP